MERHALIAARILISIIFLLNGLNIIGQTLAMHEMAAHGVPVSLIPALIMGARALQLIAGTALVLGIYPRISAIALLLFLIPATLMAHAFWQTAGTSLYMVELINFFQECMYGWWIGFYSGGKRPTCFASTLKQGDSYAPPRHATSYPWARRRRILRFQTG